MNRAEELIADLEAEIVKRDARIEVLLGDSKALARNLKGKHALTGATYEHLASRLDSLQAELEQQRGGVVLPERDVPAFHAEESPNWHGCIGWNAAIDAVARLNPPGECVAVPRELLERLETWVQSDCSALADLQALLAQQGKAVGDE